MCFYNARSRVLYRRVGAILSALEASTQALRDNTAAGGAAAADLVCHCDAIRRLDPHISVGSLPAGEDGSRSGHLRRVGRRGRDAQLVRLPPTSQGAQRLGELPHSG